MSLFKSAIDKPIFVTCLLRQGPKLLCHHQFLETEAAGLKSRIAEDLAGQMQNTSSDFIPREQILPRENACRFIRHVVVS